ncbi:MAG: hypothetical protein NTU57_04440 [Candidatus Aenigmarchaeota archaeon]|nr:hypothetical protein [Candidatus Aenigmarchaeota archaeon]
MKTKLLIGLLIIVAIVICGVYFLIPKNIICTNFVLDDAHKIIDSSKTPQGWGDQNPRSPNDNSTLTKIILDSDDPNIMDEPWRYAFYSGNENIFWIVDMPGELLGGWYGPFEGKPCL